MKLFACPSCGTTVHFDNTSCLLCGADLAYDAESADIVALAGRAICANRAAIACNWTAAAPGRLCEVCAATGTIPDLAVPGNAHRWARIEHAKRRLWYSLIRLGLPREDKALSLRFRLLADAPGPDGRVVRVLTGHARAVVTLNIAEADDALREASRVRLGEPYRTLLGHLRHEVGHFYWDMLVRGRREDDFRALFGDASQDYAGALARHYAHGPPPDWPERTVSAYAAAHPWEDFAETWAHYLHMVDGLETAARHGFAADAGAYENAALQPLLAVWIPFSVAMNEMNRAMGQADFYPFVIAPKVAAKLGFVHDLIRAARS